MKESNIQKEIRLALSEAGATTWVNTVGKGWTGDRFIRQSNGDMLIKNPRPLHAGLCVGSSDLIGVNPEIITEEMVGSIFGRFIGPEIKTPKGPVRTEQEKWLAFMQSRGAKAGVCRSVEDALALIGKTK